MPIFETINPLYHRILGKRNDLSALLCRRVAQPDEWDDILIDQAIENEIARLGKEALDMYPQYSLEILQHERIDMRLKKGN